MGLGVIEMPAVAKSDLLERAADQSDSERQDRPLRRTRLRSGFTKTSVVSPVGRSESRDDELKRTWREAERKGR
jgi:hypothetical protein